ncbi:MAG: 3-deoxy-D-manno-octulosonic acid transferase, partial [Planctomycetes bacterium]|nr:3-deoxy-D-manno-octulosonic acid transferase [Planctomycetota bacterium]
LLAALLVASRGLTRPKHRRGLLEKLGAGVPRRDGARPLLWVHAVSVGEVLTALPLVEAIHRRHAGLDLCVSVSTFTGLEVARKRLGDLPVIYFPLDLSPVIGRFFRRLRPAAVLLVELELWPNFLLEARRRGVPVLVANGRITERSARRYALGRGLTRHAFNLVESFGAQNEEYRERFLRLGVEPSRVEVLGNLKHDREPAVPPGRGLELRRRLGWPPGETSVLASGSTHPGEERALLGAYASLKASHPGLRLVLAPRHVERLADPAETSRWGAREPLVRWSVLREGAASGPPPEPFVLLVDTLGELELFYSLADLVFVGGSLVPRGGHNLLEAARHEKALLFGPHVDNFREEAGLLLSEGGAVQLQGLEGLEPGLDRLLRSPAEREALARSAALVARRLRGAVARHMDWLDGHLRLYLPPQPC